MHHLHIIGFPSDAAGEVADFDRDFAGNSTADVPLQRVVAPGWEGGVQQIDFFDIVQNAKVDSGRVDQGVGPGKRNAVDALLDGQ